MGIEQLRKQVRRARRRMAVQRFAGLVGWTCFATLVIAAVLVTVDKYRPLGVEAWQWLAGAVGLGVVGAAIWTWWTRNGELEAAVEIDRRFGLRERVSSWLALSPDEQASPAGQALLHDALRRLERIEVREQFGVRLSRGVLLPFGPALAAVLVSMFLNPASPDAVASQTAQESREIKKSAKQLQDKLAERKKLAREQGLKDAEDLLQKLEQGSKDLQKGELDQKKALVKLNDLAQELQERRQQLGSGESLQKQLEQLKDLNKGPAEKLAEALQKGDFAKAQNELQQLQQKLAQGKLDPAQKAALAKQLEQMQAKLGELAQAQQKAEAELKRQIAEKRAAGKAAEADELERQLAEIQKQGQQAQRAQKLAEKMGQCAKCLAEGQGDKAAQALADLQADLQGMQRELDERKMLDDAEQQLAQCKNGMCQGLGKGDKPGRGDFAKGEGRGAGKRDEQKTDTSARDSRVRQQVTPGASIVTDSAEGPNQKGQVAAEIQAQFEAAAAAPSDPLSGQQLPRSYRDHARGYFDALRDGE
jgi:hypothetical protein